jgi:hypothetical protein
MSDSNVDSIDNTVGNTESIDRKRKAIDFKDVVIEGKRERKVTKFGSDEILDDKETAKVNNTNIVDIITNNIIIIVNANMEKIA